MNKKKALLITVLVLSLFVKLVFLHLAREIKPVRDAKQYYINGAEIATGAGYRQLRPSFIRAPGYAFFLAGIFSFFPKDVFLEENEKVVFASGPVLAAKIIQVLLSTATVFLVYLLGISLFSWRAGISAAALAIQCPETVCPELSLDRLYDELVI